MKEIVNTLLVVCAIMLLILCYLNVRGPKQVMLLKTDTQCLYLRYYGYTDSKTYTITVNQIQSVVNDFRHNVKPEERDDKLDELQFDLGELLMYQRGLIKPEIVIKKINQQEDAATIAATSAFM